jgi:hypothetical protein
MATDTHRTVDTVFRIEQAKLIAVMMKTTEDGSRCDSADTLDRSLERGIFVERAMNSRRLVIGSIRRYASPNTIGRVARRNFTTARSQNRNLSRHCDVVTRLALSFTDDHLEHGRAVFGDASDFDHIDLLRGARLPQTLCRVAVRRAQ